MGLYDTASNSRMWAIYIMNANDNWYVNISSDGTAAALTSIPIVLNDTKWHTWTYIIPRSAENILVYRDGSYLGSYANGRTYSNRQSFLTIGGLDTGNYFNGNLEYLYIHNTLPEISWLHREPYAMFQSPVLSKGYLDFGIVS